MIGPGTGVRVYLACGVTDIESRAERVELMRAGRGALAQRWQKPAQQAHHAPVWAEVRNDR